MTAIRLPFTPLRDIETFSVEDTRAQVTVRSPDDSATVSFRDQRAELVPHDGAVTASIEGLEPGTDNHLRVDTDDRSTTLQVTTRPTIGSVRARFATISDLHLGLEAFGIVKKQRADDEPPYALRCAQAAIDEAVDWGAELLVIKGDVTEKGSAAQWDMVAELLDRVPIPMMITIGNHDCARSAEIDPYAALRELGFDTSPVQVRDLSGIRVIIGDTSIRHRGHGTLAPISDELVSAATASAPAFVAIHHNIQRIDVPWFWPPGIASSNAKPLVTGLSRANPHVMISSGHTHRNRRHRIGPHGRILATEVASTSDYPGVWAAYEVSDSMIRQTVRRITRPDVHRWTERTRRAVGGVWPRWSQGRIDDRCVDLVFD